MLTEKALNAWHEDSFRKSSQMFEFNYMMSVEWNNGFQSILLFHRTKYKYLYWTADQYATQHSEKVQKTVRMAVTRWKCANSAYLPRALHCHMELSLNKSTATEKASRIYTVLPFFCCVKVARVCLHAHDLLHLRFNMLKMRILRARLFCSLHFSIHLVAAAEGLLVFGALFLI